MADTSANTTFDATKQSGESNVDYLNRLLTSGQYATPQDAINQFNNQHLSADSSGLSSNYGSSPAYYSTNGGEIGLPDRYLVKQADGSWQTIMRSPSSSAAPAVQPVQPTLPTTSTPAANTANSVPGINTVNVGLPASTPVVGGQLGQVNSQAQQAAINNLLG